MSRRILVILCHPTLENSRVNQRLIFEAQSHAYTVVHDLYECYPDFHIDVKWEQYHLSAYDGVVFQHPLYWYSCPALMKEWMDLVLGYNFAYGPEGHALASKYWLQVISTGGNEYSYSQQGFHENRIEQYLKAFEMTAKMCQMDYHSPLVVHDAHKLSSIELDEKASEYKNLLDQLSENSVNAV